MSVEATLSAARTRLAHGDTRAAARMLLAIVGSEADALLDGLPPDGPHGAAFAERLRFGPPETWLGWKRGTGRVAVKLFPAGMAMPPDLPARAAFHHPGVAPLLAWGSDWTVHAWAAGRSLAAARRNGAAAPDCLTAITEAVAALHGAGLAHGDLTPANIILTGHGAVLIDWGEDAAGTPGWRPDGPHGAVERDLFALGKLRSYFLPGGSQ